MRLLSYILSIILVLLTGLSACKKAYAPKLVKTGVNYLVVEGVINSGAGDTTYIKLSRMVQLASKAAPKAEHNALVTVEGDNSSTYQLGDSGDGIYKASLGGLTSGSKFRLRIKTTDNKEYLSDYMEVKITPPIDSVSYSVQNSGVQFYLNAHDPTGKTRFYRWDFDETFGYLSVYKSFYKIGADSLPQYRIDQADKIYECFKTLHSEQVLTNSSAKLSQDVINRQPIDFITQESGKISHGYSILVRQYALTEGAFNFWQNLKRNTEQIGSIFDAQPSEVQGNIHCVTDPTEPVVGYMSISTVTTARVFLDAQATGLFVPPYLPPPTLDECQAGGISTSPASDFASRLYSAVTYQNNVLISATFDRATGQIIGYTYAPAPCVDCRTKQPLGTNLVPVFWPAAEHE